MDADGLKPGDKYNTRDAAAKAAFAECWEKSKKENKEYAGRLYQNPDGTWSYTAARRGTEAGSNPGDYPSDRPRKRGGRYHTHGGDSNGKYDDEHFSPQDKVNAQKEGVSTYVATPGGTIQRFDPNKKSKHGGTTTVIQSPSKSKSTGKSSGNGKGSGKGKKG